MIPIALVGLASLLSVYILQSNGTSNSVKYPYDYLTEFILTLSNWSGLTYYDVNALLHHHDTTVFSGAYWDLVFSKLQTKYPSLFSIKPQSGT